MIPRKLDIRVQIQEAARLGHSMSIEKRERADFPDAPPKFFLTCTCGYKAAARRSEKAALGVAIWHVGDVVTQEVEDSPTHQAERLRNGLPIRQTLSS